MALTKLERQILKLRSEGLTNSQVSSCLHRYPSVVSRCRINACKKISRAWGDLAFVSELNKAEMVMFNEPVVPVFEVKLSRNCTVTPSCIGRRKN